MAFTSRSLISMGTIYNNIEKEAVGILHGLEKFQLYWYIHKVNIITDDKPLLAVVFLALVKITPADTNMCINCYCMNLRVSVYLHVCMIIYIYSDNAL